MYSPRRAPAFRKNIIARATANHHRETHWETRLMPLYESVFIVRQDVSAQHVEGLAERYTEMIKENGGQVAKTEYWGLKNLALSRKEKPQGPLHDVQHRWAVRRGR